MKMNNLFECMKEKTYLNLQIISVKIVINFLT